MQLHNNETNYEIYNKNFGFNISQEYPYLIGNKKISVEQAFNILLNFMKHNNLDYLYGLTHLFIVPQYEIRTINGLITNFHLPKSTLLLLVSAFIGIENCRDIYQNALLNDYQFLSYGDASLLYK
jgi:S-adenosylmethionine:tRNA ribosyltransferase-isomerase